MSVWEDVRELERERDQLLEKIDDKDSEIRTLEDRILELEKESGLL